MTKKYDESSIQRHAGLSGIRKKPTPYIGPNDSSGLWTIVREPCDNCVDQALAGRNKLVHLIVQKGTYYIIDSGEGIPVGYKVFENEHGVKEKLSTLYVITGLTHGGSNFGDSGNISRGTHGLGAKTSNAMSKDFQVWTKRDNKWYTIIYKDAKLVSETAESAPPKLPFGFKATKGTVVKMTPDLSLFVKGTKLPMQEVKDWFVLTSILVPGLECKFTDETGRTKTLKTDGPSEYLKSLVSSSVVTGNFFLYSSKTLDVAVAFTDAEGDNVKCYTNGLYNKDGGEHAKALVDSLAKSLLPFSKKDKSGKLKYSQADLRDGLVGLVNYKIEAPKFNNQPKDRLVDERVYKPAVEELTQAWTKFWTKNKSMAKDLIERAESLRSKTQDFLKDKRLAKSVNAVKRTIFTKLARITGKAPVSKRELILVEGDSAGGSLKRVRDRSYQAVFPLKGKPLNVWSSTKDKVLANKEVVEVLAALGLNLSSTTGNGQINYGKVICFADPDVDGSHINSLLLGILYKYVPHLFDEGCVFVVKAPLYKTRHKNKVYFGQSKEELYKTCGSTNLDIQYLKGWGEVNAEDLYIALDPERRTLYQVLPPESKASKTNFGLLLGPSPAFRKTLLNVA